jgi:hypothetical protein
MVHLCALCSTSVNTTHGAIDISMCCLDGSDNHRASYGTSASIMLNLHSAISLADPHIIRWLLAPAFSRKHTEDNPHFDTDELSSLIGT